MAAVVMVLEEVLAKKYIQSTHIYIHSNTSRQNLLFVLQLYTNTYIVFVYVCRYKDIFSISFVFFSVHIFLYGSECACMCMFQYTFKMDALLGILTFLLFLKYDTIADFVQHFFPSLTFFHTITKLNTHTLKRTHTTGYNTNTNQRKVQTSP